MNRRIEIECSNCKKVNYVNESELVSGVPLKDIQGNVVEEHPPVTIDANTLVACDACRYPMSCENAKFFN